MRYFFTGKSSVAFKPELLIPDSAISKEILAIGIGPFIIEASNSAMMIFVNNALATYGGDVSIAAFGIIHRLLLLIFLPILGISFGLQSIVDYNYGAKQFSRVVESVKLALKVSTLFSLPGFLAMFLFPVPIIQIFIPGPELTTAGAGAMRIVVLIALHRFSARGHNRVSGPWKTKISGPWKTKTGFFPVPRKATHIPAASCAGSAKILSA